MREKLRLDTYNVIIIALIPFVLMVAWGLTWGYERNLHAQQCEDTIVYLEEVAGFSQLYTNVPSAEDTDRWLEQIKVTSVPAPARDLHDSAIAALTWASTTNLEIDTSQPAGLYDRLTSFKRVLDSGRETLATRCPEAEALVPAAFPMYFREEGA